MSILLSLVKAAVSILKIPDPENPDPEPVLFLSHSTPTVDNFVEYPQDLDASVPDSKTRKIN